MSEYIIIGTSLVFLGTTALCRGVFSYYDRKTQSYGEFLRLLYILRQKIGTSAMSPVRILEEEEGLELLDSLGYIEKARQYGLYHAFADTEKCFCMDKEDKMLLKKYFSGFGSDMMSSELENLSLVIDTFERKHGQVRTEMPAKKKIASVMIVCCAMMLIIMII